MGYKTPPHPKWTSENNPRKKKGTKHPFSKQLITELESEREIIVEGILIDSDESSGKAKIKVIMPTLKMVTAQLLKAAAKGNLKAMEMVMDRVEGKPIQKIITEEEKESGFDLSKLTDDELSEFNKLETRRDELLSKCIIEE